MLQILMGDHAKEGKPLFIRHELVTNTVKEKYKQVAALMVSRSPLDHNASQESLAHVSVSGFGPSSVLPLYSLFDDSIIQQTVVEYLKQLVNIQGTGSKPP